MSQFLCNFCNKNFNNKYSLEKHKLTTKYCLKIQTKNEIEIENENKNICTLCNKKFTTKQSVNIHLKSCKENIKLKEQQKENYIDSLKNEILKKDNQIDLLKKEKEDQIDLLKKEKEDQIDLLKKELYLLKKEKTYFENRSINYKEQLDKRIEEINNLQNRLEKLALKAIEKPTSTSTHNTIINNLPVFHSQEFINNKIQDKFDDRYFHNEMKGIVQFTYDHILTLDNGNLVYVCCDYGRKNFKYKDKDGNEITDPEAIKLISMIQDKLYDKTCYLHDWAVNEYDYLKLQEERDEIVDKKELDSVIDMIGKAQDMKNVIKSMNKTNKFSNELAKLTVIKK